MRALLVEDSRTCAALALGLLRHHGYAVERQGSARGARAAMGTAFDLALIDAHIPEAEGGSAAVGPLGLDVAVELRRRQPACRVVVWSDDARSLRAEAWRLSGLVIVAKGNTEALRGALGLGL